MKKVEGRTKSAGGDFLNEVKNRRTAQRSPAERMAELTMAALFATNPHVVTASVVHEWPGDKQKGVASGCRVKIGPKGIELDPLIVSNEVVEQITASRRQIVADQTT